MVGLKSLGLAGARNALRRLFRRPPPAAESATSTSTSKHDISTAAQESSSASISSPTPAPAPARGAGATTQTPPPRPPQQQQEDHAQDGDTHSAMATEALTMHHAGVAARLPLTQQNHGSKENLPPRLDEDITAALGKLTIGTTVGPGPSPVVDVDAGQDEKLLDNLMPDLEDPAVRAERAQHLHFIGEALDMARLALRTNETPVGCVLVHNGTVIARGMNATNVTRNGTRHAEFMALSALLSYAPESGPRTTCLRPKQDRVAQPDGASDVESTDSTRAPPDEGNEDGSKSHLYPYGQKLHPDPKVDRAIIRESTLYVTVEPCVMCASLLRQLGIKKVYFGAVNDKFGGTGGVFSIHANSLPVSEDGQTASAHPTPKPVQLPDGSGVLGMSFPPGGGDGGNVEPGYEIEGGWGRDEAVGLLRRFYVQENGRAPIPRKKEGRAARLAALLEQDGNASSTSLVSQSTRNGEADDAATGGALKKENIDPSFGRKADAAHAENGTTDDLVLS
ncbi:tRNA-specific adenosine deaminase TAD2 [Paramyrothecium foliicola]|nr:tRNA-specific adenosine deaminase TAD2 [Paramyrothecium foliicola]